MIRHVHDVLSCTEVFFKTQNIQFIMKKTSHPPLDILEYVDLPEMKSLIQSSENLGAQDQNGCNVLHWAVALGNSKALDVLLANVKGNSNLINAKNVDGCTPLHLAVFFLDLSCIKLLIDADAMIDVKDHQGYTALDRAAFYYNIKVVDCFRENSKCFTCIDNPNDSAGFKTAIQTGNIEAVLYYLFHEQYDSNLIDENDIKCLRKKILKYELQLNQYKQYLNHYDKFRDSIFEAEEPSYYAPKYNLDAECFEKICVALRMKIPDWGNSFLTPVEIEAINRYREELSILKSLGFDYTHTLSYISKRREEFDFLKIKNELEKQFFNTFGIKACFQDASTIIFDQNINEKSIVEMLTQLRHHRNIDGYSENHSITMTSNKEKILQVLKEITKENTKKKREMQELNRLFQEAFNLNGKDFLIDTEKNEIIFAPSISSETIKAIDKKISSKRVLCAYLPNIRENETICIHDNIHKLLKVFSEIAEEHLRGDLKPQNSTAKKQLTGITSPSNYVFNSTVFGSAKQVSCNQQILKSLSKENDKKKREIKELNRLFQKAFNLNEKDFRIDTEKHEIIFASSISSETIKAIDKKIFSKGILCGYLPNIRENETIFIHDNIHKLPKVFSEIAEELLISTHISPFG